MLWFGYFFYCWDCIRGLVGVGWFGFVGVWEVCCLCCCWDSVVYVGCWFWWKCWLVVYKDVGVVFVLAVVFGGWFFDWECWVGSNLVVLVCRVVFGWWLMCCCYWLCNWFGSWVVVGGFGWCNEWWWNYWLVVWLVYVVW